MSNFELSNKVVKLATARRHTIKLNGISAEGNQYALTTTRRSRQLITEPVESMAFFCNEYIPDHFPDSQYIKYILTINGTDHEVVPINSEKNGKKIVRTTASGLNSDYVLYLSESIKSAYLTIIIKTPNKTETPFISNLKVLIGGK